MKIYEVYCRRWFFPKWVSGIVIYPFIFYQVAKMDKYTRRHEWEHIAQVEHDGWLKFYVRWLWQRFTVGYYRIDYEIEAYAAEGDHREPWAGRNIKIIDKPDD